MFLQVHGSRGVQAGTPVPLSRTLLSPHFGTPEELWDPTARDRVLRAAPH